MSHGCIFKLLNAGKLQKVSVRCLTDNETEWKEVKDHSAVSVASAFYEARQLDQDIFLVKLEKLEDGKEYEVLVETDNNSYSNVVVIKGRMNSLCE